MRCLSCNKLLSGREATRKYASNHSFVDLCDGCFSHVADQIPVINNTPPQEDDYEAETEFDGDDSDVTDHL